ncbi:MAG: ABC transporter permease [Gemmatimonadetes bacterium]|nr:ABC transporter permease [Gemmatimonadota bacterium]
MLRALLRRGGQAALVVGLVAVATFALIHLAPGDPFGASLDDARVAPEVRAHWRAVYGLGRPLPEQFGRWTMSLARGELGYSFSQHRPVADVIRATVPNTIQLMGVALVLSFALGIGTALAQARRPGGWLDRALGTTTLATWALPDFWLGLVLLLAFSYWLPWFPAGGMTDDLHESFPPWWRAVDRLRHLVLPAGTLALLTAAQVARHQRVALDRALAGAFVRTARAKGAAPPRVLLRHAWRAALLPVITQFGVALPGLLGGAVFIEGIFSWPGMGRVAIDAIGARDYPLVMACVLIGAVLVAIGAAAADLLQQWADPRLRRTA